MSFAYKLWKIGRALTDEEIWDSMIDSSEDDVGEDRQYINIDFTVVDGNVTRIDLKKDAVERGKMFFTKKIGGTSNSYYLYPNLSIRNSLPKDKIQLLVNTLEYGMARFATDENRRTIESVLALVKDIKTYFERAEIEAELADLRNTYEKQNITSDDNLIDEKDLKKTEQAIEKKEKNLEKKTGERTDWNADLINISTAILPYLKADYWIWFSVNGKSFFDAMPEIKDNWFQCPVDAHTIVRGYDVFTNRECNIGYLPEVKVFSYDQYHDNLKRRLAVNLPLSLESARHIKFAWQFILKHLVFYYNRLEYVVIPNLLSDDVKAYRTVLKRFSMANKKSQDKRSTLEKLNAQEKKLRSDMEKLEKKKKTSAGKETDIHDLKQKHRDTITEIGQLETGMIREFGEQIEDVGDLQHAITIDYFFTDINRTNLSFEIKGSLENIIPSRIQEVVAEMNKKDSAINDLVKLGQRNHTETYLQDYFNRDELSIILNRSWDNNKNRVLKERLYLAKLLLTDTKIDADSLMERFRQNRLYGYDKKKRLTKDGTCEWIDFTERFTKNETIVYNFFNKLKKIKG
jgi:CRISPR-associated protein Csh1